MKTHYVVLIGSLALGWLTLLAGCAASAATAGYALKADSATSLTPEAENRIVERTKRETITDLEAKYPGLAQLKVAKQPEQTK